MTNLEAEMERHGVQIDDLCRDINCTDTALRRKLCGETGFTYGEAVTIRNTWFPGLSLEYLFSRESKQKECGTQ